MTLKTNARLAGFTFLFYIVAAITEMTLEGKVIRGEGAEEKLLSIAQHATSMRLAVVLLMLTVVCALTLAVTLYALTREEDADLALFAMSCRLIEGAINCIPAIATFGLLSLALAQQREGADAAAMSAVAALLLKVGNWCLPVGGTIFSVGSAVFAYLFLRARSIPRWLAWTGFLGSLLTIVVLPLNGMHLLSGPVVMASWLPLFVFEITLGVWLMVKGVAPATR